MLVTKETVFQLVVRDTTKVVVEARPNGGRIEVGYGKPTCIVDFDIDNAEEQKAFVQIVEETLESSLSAMEFFFKLTTHPEIPDYFGRTTK